MATDALDAELVAAAATHVAGGCGVLLETRSHAHRLRIITLLRAAGVAACGFKDGAQACYKAVVVTASECRGYNWASRLGALVRPVIPGNAAQVRWQRWLVAFGVVVVVVVVAADVAAVVIVIVVMVVIVAAIVAAVVVVVDDVAIDEP